MKITTWNVNGIRSLKSVSNILNDFASDIVCFQETKVSRAQLPEEAALVEGYTSYFSYPRKRSGYSGVATYCKAQFTPNDAEESLVVDDDLKVELEFLDIFSGLGDFSEIDFEGRVIVTHHLIKYQDVIHRLAVINVYCPRVDPDKPERHFYKMQFCHLLQKKMYQFCHQNSFAIIVGDLNIACSPIDHCDPGDEEEFNSSEARQWLKSFFSSEIQIDGEYICAIDAFRHFYPDRKEAYTCWNTKTGARLTNYGTRIDYVIVSSNLLPLLSNCEILSDYLGSDHCPVCAELKCESIPELKVRLPSICTRFWPEFAGHQQKLQTFFQKVQDIADTVTNCREESRSLVSSKIKTVSKKNKQKSITSFFKNSPSVHPESNSSQKSSLFTNGKADTNIISSPSSQNSQVSNSSDIVESQVDEQSSNLICDSSGEDKNSNESNLKSKEWKTLFSGPPKPPLCKHNIHCVLRTVKKNGPNMGRQFFMCAQPAGPASNPDANCNFFKWVNAPKLNTLK